MKHLTLKDARDAKGWTQEELEQRSGVSQSTIVRCETDPNVNPTVNVVTKLESALELKRGTLIFGREALAS